MVHWLEMGKIGREQLSKVIQKRCDIKKKGKLRRRHSLHRITLPEKWFIRKFTDIMKYNQQT